MGNLPSHSKRALSSYSQTGESTVKNKRKYTKGEHYCRLVSLMWNLKKKNTGKSNITIY